MSSTPQFGTNALARAVAGALCIGMATGVMAQQRDAQALETVVVTASGFSQDIKNAPASITVITQQELQTRPFRNVADALSDVEGIDVQRGGKAGGMNIRIRGMPAEYTLILVDGRRMSAGGEASRPNGFGDVDTNFIPPLGAIERIEVVRGPMSTLYGSDAIGGVVNIITKKVGETWSGSVQLDATLQGDSTYGDLYGANFYLNGPLVQDKLGLSLRGGLINREAAGGFKYTDYDGSQQEEYGFNGLGKSKIRTVGARLAWTPDAQNDITLDADTASQTFDNRKGEVGQLTGGYADEAKFTRDRYVLAHTGRYGFGTWDSSVLYDTSETKGRLNPPSRPARVTDNTSRDIKYDNLVLDSKLTSSLLDGKHLLTVGGQYWKQKLKDTYVDLTHKHVSQYQWALFVEDEWKLRPDLAFTAGLRYDNNEQFGGNWSPRGYLVWNPTSKLTVKGGISRGYKTPALNQMVDGIYNLGGQGTIPLLGNSNLVPEKSTSTELGLIFDNLDGKTAGITAFYNSFKDKLSSERVGNCRFAVTPGCLDMGNWPQRNNPSRQQADFSRRINVDKAVTKGVELTGKLPIGDDWLLSANYTYTDSEQKSGSNEGRPLNDIPKHMINAKLNWYPTDALTAWVQGEYRAKQYRGVAVADGSDAYYKNYALFNLGASYVVNKNVTLSAAVYNLFDKDFNDFGTNPTSASAAYANRYDQFREGRRFWLSTNIQF